MSHSRTNIIGKYNSYENPLSQQGFALFISLIIVLLVGIVAVSSLRITEMTEVLSGNSIERSRAFQAAEGALIEGEKSAIEMTEGRIFANTTGSYGLYSSGNLPENWWRDPTDINVTTADLEYPAVASNPTYVVEEVGDYVSDGGSGIVSLDRGSASYGRKTSSGREVVLYRLQSHGVGVTDVSQAVVESLYVQDR